MSKMTICGVDFEYCGTTRVHTVKQRTLWDCYANPSHTKQQIYCYWRDFFHDEVGTRDFGVSSYNCNFFTIEAIFEIDEIKYLAVITARHNRLYEIV